MCFFLYFIKKKKCWINPLIGDQEPCVEAKLSLPCGESASYRRGFPQEVGRGDVCCLRDGECITLGCHGNISDSTFHMVCFLNRTLLTANVRGFFFTSTTNFPTLLTPTGYPVVHFKFDTNDLELTSDPTG